MSARSRPRSSFKSEDNADEQQLWSSIVDKIKRCNVVSRKLTDVKARIQAAEIALQGEDSGLGTAQNLEELEKLHREGLKLAEEELKILNDEPDDLLRNLDTLISVRSAFEVETPRAAPPAKRGNLKRRHDPDSGIDSPAPVLDTLSPASASRGSVTKAASRSGSVAAASGKSEVQSDGSDQVKPLMSTPDKLAKLAVGSEVFYRHKGPNLDGLGFLARVVHVTNDKSGKKYKIKDIEPDAEENKGKLASAGELMAIPPVGVSLPTLPKGKSVYAVYPNTTTIYNAKVVSAKKEMCRLVFENDDEQENDVERRYVLDPDTA